MIEYMTVDAFSVKSTLQKWIDEDRWVVDEGKDTEEGTMKEIKDLRWVVHKEGGIVHWTLQYQTTGGRWKRVSVYTLEEIECMENAESREEESECWIHKEDITGGGC